MTARASPAGMLYSQTQKSAERRQPDFVGTQSGGRVGVGAGVGVGVGVVITAYCTCNRCRPNLYRTSGRIREDSLALEMEKE